MENSGDPNSFTVQYEDVVCFRFGKESKLEKLFKAYCNKKQVHHESMQFFYKGNRIRPTPDCPSGQAEGGVRDRRHHAPVRRFTQPH